jgi:hypothetical protein
VEADVWGFGLGDRMVVEVDCREAADVFVAHALASLQVFRLVKVDERERFGGGSYAFELECCGD